MRPAGWPVAAAFGVAVALLVLLVGPLLLFNPWFVSALQQRHGVADAFDTTQAEVDRVTGEMLGDLFTGGDFDASFEPAAGPLLDEAERSHMSDVSRLVRILAGVAVLAAVAVVATGLALRGQPRRMATALVVTASAIGLTGLVLAIVFAVAFEPAFLAFHAVFFPPGTYLFEPGSDLITLFPGGFWFDASVLAGATVVLSAAVVLAIGLAGRRRPPPPLRSA